MKTAMDVRIPVVLYQGHRLCSQSCALQLKGAKCRNLLTVPPRVRIPSVAFRHRSRISLDAPQGGRISRKRKYPPPLPGVFLGVGTFANTKPFLGGKSGSIAVRSHVNRDGRHVFGERYIASGARGRKTKTKGGSAVEHSRSGHCWL